MTARPPDPPCDSSRLDRLLRDELPEVEKAMTVEHLDRCEDCQRRIERLAAGSRWWHDVRSLVEAADDARQPWSSPEEPWLGFLDPPEKDGPIGRLGSYEVLEVIGRGGMGVVLKAHDPSLNRFVAIKVLAPHLAGTAAARRRFAREARAAAAVSHEHVVAIHAVDSAGRLPYLVMQYVAGQVAPAADRPDRPPRDERDPADRHAGGCRARRGPRPGADPPRHQAVEHPAGERRRAGQAHRLRPGPRPGRRQPHAERTRRRHAAVHGPRAGPGRAGRPPRRPVQPGQRAVRHGLRMAAVPRIVDDRRAAAGLRRVPARRSASSTPTSPSGWPRSSPDCTPRTRPTGSSPRPRWPPCSAGGWPTYRAPTTPRPEPTRSVSAIRRPSLR